MPDHHAIRIAAAAWRAAGATVLPIKADGSKAPALLTWTDYIGRGPTDTEHANWFGPDRFALGVVMGAQSGGLEMLEFEGRALAEGILTEFEQLLADNGLAELWKRITSGYVEQTPSGGHHYVYRCPAPVGNTKLASRPATDDELAESKQPVRVLIETRGEGGQVVVAPSFGPAHGTGLPWVILRGDPGSIAEITTDERDTLFEMARMLDTLPPRPEPVARAYVGERGRWGKPTPERPLDYLERVLTWAQILEPHGWSYVVTRGDTSYWCRPGKLRGVSATTGHAADRDRLYVFTTSTSLPAEVPLTKGFVYAELNHGGNMSATAAEFAALMHK